MSEYKTTHDQYYDRPDANAMIINTHVIPIQLDDYSTFAPGSFNLKTLIQFILQINEPLKSIPMERRRSKQESERFDRFEDFYNKLNRMTQKNLNHQYEALKQSLYFEQGIDDVVQKLKNIINKSIRTDSTNMIESKQPTPIFVQGGGRLEHMLTDLKKFIVFVVKYIQQDDNLESIELNDFYGKSFKQYQQDKNLVVKIDDGIKQAMVRKLLCGATILKIIRYKLKCLLTGMGSKNIIDVLNLSITNTLNDYINDTNNTYDDSDVTVEIDRSNDHQGIDDRDKINVQWNRIHNMYGIRRKQFESYIYVESIKNNHSQKQKLKPKETTLQDNVTRIHLTGGVPDLVASNNPTTSSLSKPLTPSFFTTPSTILSTEPTPPISSTTQTPLVPPTTHQSSSSLDSSSGPGSGSGSIASPPRLILSAQSTDDKPVTTNIPIVQPSKDKQNDDKPVTVIIPIIQPSEEKQNEEKQNNNEWGEEKQNDIESDVDLIDKSGSVKPDQRIVFLINLPNGKRYGIKISTDRFPQYKIEGKIYSQFKSIMNDENEPYGEKIEEQVLNCYFLGEITNVNANEGYLIYLHNHLGVRVSSNTNSALYNAIKTIADANRCTSVYYYVTENILGTWNILRELYTTITDSSKICDLVTNVTRLLSYLNKEYKFVHWDLHPENIFINKSNPSKFKIYDFDFSEITLSSPSTYANNTYINIMSGSSRQSVIDTSRKIKSYDAEIRSNVGLMFDIYRMYTSFILLMNKTCVGKNYAKLQILDQLMCAALESIADDMKLLTDYYGYLLEMSNKSRNALIDDQDRSTVVIRWIQENFAFNTQIQPVIIGGSIQRKRYVMKDCNCDGYKMYLAHKQKYLYLTKNNKVSVGY
jgi:hypothetical protein